MRTRFGLPKGGAILTTLQLLASFYISHSDATDTTWFIEQPQAVNTTLGSSDVLFQCITAQGMPYWLINNRDASGFVTDNGVTLSQTQNFEGGGKIIKMWIPATEKNNGLEIQCGVHVEGEGLDNSDPVLLKLQGLLDAPANVNISCISSHQALVTWNAPFTLDITNIEPDITEYRVYVHTTDNGSDPMMFVERVVATNYTAEINDTLKYSVMISAVNELGEGAISDPAHFTASECTESSLSSKWTTYSANLLPTSTSLPSLTPTPTPIHIQVTDHGLSEKAIPSNSTAQFTIIIFIASLEVGTAVLLVAIMVAILATYKIVKTKLAKKITTEMNEAYGEVVAVKNQSPSKCHEKQETVYATID